MPAPAPAPEPEIVDEVLEEVEVADPEQLDEQALGGDDILNTSTDELDSPTRPADAHRGRILSVEAIRSTEKGTPGIQFNLHSDDLDFDDRYTIWVPPTWAEDIFVSPLELPEGTRQIVDGKSKIVGNEKGQYAGAIHNKKNDADIDKVRIIAKAQGRTLQGATAPQTFEDYVELLNQLCAELPVVFRRRPDRNNPRFLRVVDLLDIETVENDTKVFKGFVKAWAQE